MMDPTLDTNEQRALTGAGFEPLAASAARSIRQAILDGRLPPGTKIRQESLAAELGISRIPVREALQELTVEGLLTFVPNSGARVTALTAADLHEIALIRERIEPLALAESVANLAEADLERMRADLDALDAGAAPEVRLARDRSFHLTSYSGAPMPRLRKLIDGYWDLTQNDRRRRFTLAPAHGDPAAQSEHRLILDACQRRDPDDAESILRVHIRRGARE